MDGNGSCLNPNLYNYSVLMVGDQPDDFGVKVIRTDDPYGPFGGKSMSEVSTNGASCAIAIAIHDAMGIRMREWPFIPEKILRALCKKVS